MPTKARLSCLMDHGILSAQEQPMRKAKDGSLAQLKAHKAFFGYISKVLQTETASTMSTENEPSRSRRHMARYRKSVVERTLYSYHVFQRHPSPNIPTAQPPLRRSTLGECSMISCLRWVYSFYAQTSTATVSSAILGRNTSTT